MWSARLRVIQWPPSVVVVMVWCAAASMVSPSGHQLSQAVQMRQSVSPRGVVPWVSRPPQAGHRRAGSVMSVWPVAVASLVQAVVMSSVRASASP